MIADDLRTDPRAAGLLEAAVSHLRRGELDAAASLLEQAATAQADGGRPEDRARSLQAAAFLRGAAGDAAASAALADQAAQAAPGHLPLQVASLAQRAQACAADGRFAEAARLFGEASDKVAAAGLGADAAIALARRRGACLIVEGEFDGADAAFAQACRFADARIAAFLRVEQARLLIDAGETARARQALPANAPRDAQLQAEILVERARLQRAAGHLSDAARSAAEACVQARAALAPVPYFSGSVELSEVHDAHGERTPAYTALATAWATLADLLGPDVARAWVEPCLLALRARWGEEAFDAARREHDASRRTALGKDAS